MNLTSEPTEQAPPPLLALPAELKLEIISRLLHDEYPSQACLRRTHSSFLPLIPKSDIRSNLTETELCNQLLRTELEYAYLFPPEHYPCYFCARVQPLDAFVVAVDPFAALLFDGQRCCLDCRLLKRKSYGRSFLDSLTWIGHTLEKLPMPPSRPQLRSSTTAPVQPMPDDSPEDVKQRVLSEMYEEIFVMVNKAGWDPWRFEGLLARGSTSHRTAVAPVPEDSKRDEAVGRLEKKWGSRNMAVWYMQMCLECK